MGKSLGQGNRVSEDQRLYGGRGDRPSTLGANALRAGVTLSWLGPDKAKAALSSPVLPCNKATPTPAPPSGLQPSVGEIQGGLWWRTAESFQKHENHSLLPQSLLAGPQDSDLGILAEAGGALQRRRSEEAQVIEKGRMCALQPSYCGLMAEARAHLPLPARRLVGLRAPPERARSRPACIVPSGSPCRGTHVSGP